MRIVLLTSPLTNHNGNVVNKREKRAGCVLE